MARPMIRKLALAAVAATLVVSIAYAHSQQTLPSDTADTCLRSLTPAESLDGAVKPSDSVLFHDIPNCGFDQNSTHTMLCDATPRPTWYRASPAML